MIQPLDKKAKQFAWQKGVGSGHHAPEVVEVVRWTPTQVVVKPKHGMDKRFRIEDGGEVGGRYGSRLVPLTKAIMEEIQRERYAGAIASKCYAIEECIRQKIATNPKLKHTSVDKLQVIIKGLTEQLALIEDWERTIGGGS